MEDTPAVAEEANAPAKRGPKRNILKTKTGVDRKGSEHNGSDKEVHAECLEPLTYSMASFSLAKSLGNLGSSTVGISCSVQRFSKSVSRTEAMHFNAAGLACAPRSIRCKVRILMPAIWVSCAFVSPFFGRIFLIIKSA